MAKEEETIIGQGVVYARYEGKGVRVDVRAKGPAVVALAEGFGELEVKRLRHDPELVKKVMQLVHENVVPIPSEDVLDIFKNIVEGTPLPPKVIEKPRLDHTVHLRRTQGPFGILGRWGAQEVHTSSPEEVDQFLGWGYKIKK